MARTARISTPVEAATQPTVVVPVVFDDGAGVHRRVGAGRACGGQPSRATARPRSGAPSRVSSARPGALTVLRALKDTNVAFVSIGSTLQLDCEVYRLAGAARARAAPNDASVAFFLPTDGIDDPARRGARRSSPAALLASYKLQAGRRDRRRFDVVPLGHAAAVGRDPRRRHRRRAPRRGHRRAASTGPSSSSTRRPGYMPPKELAHQVADATRGRRARHGRDLARTADSRRAPRRTAGRRRGLGAAAVASSTPPTTRARTTELPHVALVGKGITFDSGGLSLKPPTA